MYLQHILKIRLYIFEYAAVVFWPKFQLEFYVCILNLECTLMF